MQIGFTTQMGEEKASHHYKLLQYEIYAQNVHPASYLSI